jgi:hypothetical protein
MFNLIRYGLSICVAQWSISSGLRVVQQCPSRPPAYKRALGKDLLQIFESSTSLQLARPNSPSANSSIPHIITTMNSTFTIFTAPAPASPEEIPSDFESKGSKGVICVVAAAPTMPEDIPSNWESKGSKGVICVVA